MERQCSYTLGVKDLFVFYLMRGIYPLMALSLLPLLAAVGFLFWSLSAGAFPEDYVLPFAVGVALFDVAWLALLVGVLYIRARKAPPLPAEETVLEWDDNGMRVRSDLNSFFVPWADLRWRGDGAKGLILYFPNQGCTWLTRKYVRSPLIEDMRQRLAEARRPALRRARLS